MSDRLFSYASDLHSSFCFVLSGNAAIGNGGRYYGSGSPDGGAVVCAKHTSYFCIINEDKSFVNNSASENERTGDNDQEGVLT